VTAPVGSMDSVASHQANLIGIVEKRCCAKINDQPISVMHLHDPTAPTLIMGILNLTPDSFSDGGLNTAPEDAISRALSMHAQGADIIDVGGESTRPGSLPVSNAEQQCRVLDSIRAIRGVLPQEVPISIDTTSAVVAEAALDAGADWINDTSAGRDSPDMLPLASERTAHLVLMHRQGMPARMQDAPHYADLVAEVRDFLSERADVALTAGVREDRILIDPGIGFGKRREHNLRLLAELSELASLGFPLVLGTSRKRFMGAVCRQRPPAELTPATCATTALGVMAGVRVFRVHDVAENRQAADVAWAVRNAARGDRNRAG